MGYTRYNLFDLYNGGVLIQPTIKKLRDDNTAAGLSAYVFLLIGMSFILYLFGFTNMYTIYTANTTINGTAITDPALIAGVGILQLMTDSFYGLLTLGTLTVALVAIGIASMFGVFKGAGSTILTFVIPVILLLILNIFIFPIGSIEHDLGFANDIFGAGIITGVVFLIFNGAYIMGVIEFVRGGSV